MSPTRSCFQGAVSPESASARRVSLQPTNATSCLEWWTVDFFMDTCGNKPTRSGRVEAASVRASEFYGPGATGSSALGRWALAGHSGSDDDQLTVLLRRNANADRHRSCAPAMSGKLIAAALVFALLTLSVSCGSDSDDAPVSPGLPLSVEGLIVAQPADEVRVTGTIVIDNAGTRLCAALAESFPPQCGQPAVELDNIAGFNGELQQAQGVQWTELPVVLTGTYRDGTFTIN